MQKRKTRKRKLKKGPSTQKLLLPFTALILAAALVLGRGNFSQPRPSLPPSRESTQSGMIIIDPSRKARVEILYVIDGDTIKTVGKEIVRLQGIDAPNLYTDSTAKVIDEVGSEAFSLVKDLTEGQKVELEFDPRDRLRDQYGRLLAYVWVDGEMVNFLLVERGLAVVDEFSIKKNLIYLDEFLRAQRKAQKNKLGLWGKPAG